MVILNIIWPTFALVLLIFVVWGTMVARRLGHIRRNPPTAETFASAAATDAYFTPVAAPGNNLVNLFEMPVLYFALVPLLIVTHQASLAQIALAWTYVGLRAAHSVFHIGLQVRPRFKAYFVSCVILAAMWIGYFLDIAVAAHAYSETMRVFG